MANIIKCRYGAEIRLNYVDDHIVEDYFLNKIKFYSKLKKLTK